MILATILAPVVFIITWSVFTLSGGLVTSLAALLLTSLFLPMMYVQHVKLFWPCGLLLILMSTGLIVIFAYIVSLHSKEGMQLKHKKVMMCILLSIILLLIFMNLSFSSLPSKKIYHSSKGVSVHLAVSLILIALLLFLVVNFIRIVYSKGGGFRKKF